MLGIVVFYRAFKECMFVLMNLTQLIKTIHVSSRVQNTVSKKKNCIFGIA